MSTMATIISAPSPWAAPPSPSRQQRGGRQGHISGVTDSGGWYYSWEHEGDWNPERPDIVPGDTVTASAAGSVAMLEFRWATINGAVDVGTTPWPATIQAEWFTQTSECCVRCGVNNGPPGIETTAEPDGGSYACDFDDVGWDLLPGQTVGVYYFEPDGDAVANAFQAPYARANIVWDAVDGWFGSGVTVWYTVTNEFGVVKGGASGTAKPDGWMDGIGCGCDLVPGDRITVTPTPALTPCWCPSPSLARLTWTPTPSRADVRRRFSPPAVISRSGVTPANRL